MNWQQDIGLQQRFISKSCFVLISDCTDASVLLDVVPHVYQAAEMACVATRIL